MSFGVLDGDGNVAQIEGHPFGQISFTGARGARHVRPDQVAGSIFGYTIGNDVTERDMQKSDGQWTRAKGFDSFCPLGPWIETDLAGLGKDPADLEVTCTVDGTLRQRGRTSQLLFDVPPL